MHLCIHSSILCRCPFNRCQWHLNLLWDSSLAQLTNQLVSILMLMIGTWTKEWLWLLRGGQLSRIANKLGTILAPLPRSQCMISVEMRTQGFNKRKSSNHQGNLIQNHGETRCQWWSPVEKDRNPGNLGEMTPWKMLLKNRNGLKYKSKSKMNIKGNWSKLTMKHSRKWKITRMKGKSFLIRPNICRNNKEPNPELWWSNNIWRNRKVNRNHNQELIQECLRVASAIFLSWAILRECPGHLIGTGSSVRGLWTYLLRWKKVKRLK